MAVALLLGTVPILVLAFVLTVVAGRRGWAPTLPQALMVGAVLRVTVAVLAQRGAWQPFDFFHDKGYTDHGSDRSTPARCGGARPASPQDRGPGSHVMLSSG